jgi:hypothetical protein
VAIVYLHPGQLFTFGGGDLAVGAGGTTAGIVIDWSAAVAHQGGTGQVGSILSAGTGIRKTLQRLTFAVFLEKDTGRFFYDDEEGY